MGWFGIRTPDWMKKFDDKVLTPFVKAVAAQNPGTQAAYSAAAGIKAAVTSQSGSVATAVQNAVTTVKAAVTPQPIISQAPAQPSNGSGGISAGASVSQAPQTNFVLIGGVIAILIFALKR